MSDINVAVNGDKFDLSQPIGDYSFTFKWLLDSLNENDEKFQKFHKNREIEKITFSDISDGQGYFSAVLRFIITFTDSSKAPSDDAYTTVLKIPGTVSFKKANSKSGGNNEVFEAVANVASIHQHECIFYNQIAPILEIPLPKVYKTVEIDLQNLEGCIHMEDLSNLGKTLSYFESVNLTQIKCLIQTLAHMHKNLLTTDDAIWKNKFMKHQRGFADITTFFEDLIEPFLQKCKRRNAFEQYLEKYRKFAFNKDYMIYVHQQSHQDLEISPVIVHGDIKSGNILFSIDANGDIQNGIASIIDWQVLREGSPMYDLAYFLVHNTDGVVRRQAEVFAIQYYHECLVKEFDGDKSKVPYTIEQLKHSYNYVFLTQAFFIPFLAVFMFNGMESKIKSQSLKDAFFDFITLKSLHAYEDADRLLKNEMKQVFEKYNN
uniref:CHK kinase-like domain-containing protein n=1 Tax=Panagrolaimus superbus TaxID=310955 RepID=A0A914Z1D9_9BILA